MKELFMGCKEAKFIRENATGYEKFYFNYDNLIIKNRIIYLHTSKSKVFHGILESEDLSKLTNSDTTFYFINGPFKVRG